MLQEVQVRPRHPADYGPIVGTEILDEAEELANRLEGRSILHVNATAFGGGVAELLGSFVPLTRALGLDCDWRIIEGSEAFFGVTKVMHNAIQGKEVSWSDEMEQVYLDQAEVNADLWDDDYDIVVIHDPQPAALLSVLTRRRGARPRGAWIWRCHIDTTNRYEPVWAFLRGFLDDYNASVFTLSDFVPADLAPTRIITPCIDPLAQKNIDLTWEIGREFLRAFGVDPARPVLTQISRYDPWKDPKGVIDAYRIVKQEMPEVQLLLVGSMASDDPEGIELLEETRAHAGTDPDIHLLTNLDGVGHADVNAFQTGSDVVLQKSLREGFGLTVTEAMWKRRPVIGGNVGGIRAQIEDGTSGYLVDTVEQCAARTLELLGDPDQADRMGRAGREVVRSSFTTPHLVRNWLQLMVDVVGA
jgi:trehalose synthase